MSEMTAFEQPVNPAETGLRSSRGIRWLLLAGALVSGVSVYRLVQSQWASIPAPLQFLILIAGALAIFALGTVIRRRLHLPYAGSALLFLFTGLLPVLAWGAAYLSLLSTPSGWIAFGAGMAALLGSARHVLRAELGYRGVLYPAALGGLLAAQPVLPWLRDQLAARQPGAADAIYAVAALALGVLLHAGSRHVNRFFFHRDRCDGVERQVHLIPFLLLGALYAGALTLLDLDSVFLALPLAVVGVVLAGTGEEYYAALVRSQGAVPERWPRRSVALAALGCALLAVAVPLSFLDATGRCLALVIFLAAVFLLRWAVRYGSAGAHVAGLAAALCAWFSAPNLAPRLADRLTLGVADLVGLSPASPALTALGLLGFLLPLFAASVALRRIGSPERLLRAHAWAAALVTLGVTVLALSDLAGAAVVAPLVLAAALGGIRISSRIEMAVAAHVPFAAVTLAWSRIVLGEPKLVTEPTLCVLGIAVLALVVASRFVEAGLGRWTGASDDTARSVLVLPALATAAVLLVPGFQNGGALEMALAGALAVAIAWRLPARSLPLGLIRVWGALAVVHCLTFAGWETVFLASALVGLVFVARIEIAGLSWRAAVPLRPALLLVIQLAVALAGAEEILIDSLSDRGATLLPALAVLVLGWRLLVEGLLRRAPLQSWVAVVEGVVFFGYLWAFLDRPALTLAGHVTALAAAVAFAAVSFESARRGRRKVDVWAMQLWIGAAVLHAFTARWLHLTGGVAPYVLLATGAGLYALSAWWERTDLRETFSDPLRRTGLALPAVGGLFALSRAWTVLGEAVWFPALAAFLISLFFLIAAQRSVQRIFPALASAGLLAGSLLAVVSQMALGIELYALAPGIALLALAWMLRAELGPVWSRHLAAAGASCVYATPIVALSGEISWGWLAALGVLAAREAGRPARETVPRDRGRPPVRGPHAGEVRRGEEPPPGRPGADAPGGGPAGHRQRAVRRPGDQPARRIRPHHRPCRGGGCHRTQLRAAGGRPLGRDPAPALRGRGGVRGRGRAPGPAPGGGASVKGLARRLIRRLGRSRIRLPRRPLAPADLREGDRLQIGPALWVVRGSLSLPGGSWAVHLEADEERALLLAPSEAGPAAVWTLARGEHRVEVPVECIGVYAAGGAHLDSPSRLLL